MLGPVSLGAPHSSAVGARHISMADDGVTEEAETGQQQLVMSKVNTVCLLSKRGTHRGTIQPCCSMCMGTDQALEMR